MTRIYRLTDRIPLRINDLVVTIAPLSKIQKIDIELAAKGEDLIKAGLDAASLAIKYSVKDVSGLVDSEGEGYKLSFEGDYLTDECVNELLNMKFNGQVAAVCMSLVQGIPDQFVNPITGQPIDGVEFIEGSSKEKKPILSGKLA